MTESIAAHDWPRANPPESPFLRESGDRGGWFELSATDWTVLQPVEVKATDGERRVALATGTRVRLVAYWPPLEAGNWCVWQMAWSAHALLVLSGSDTGAGVIVEGGDFSPLPRDTFDPDPVSAAIVAGAAIHPPIDSYIRHLATT